MRMQRVVSQNFRDNCNERTPPLDESNIPVWTDDFAYKILEFFEPTVPLGEDSTTLHKIVFNMSQFVLVGIGFTSAFILVSLVSNNSSLSTVVSGMKWLAVIFVGLKLLVIACKFGLGFVYIHLYRRYVNTSTLMKNPQPFLRFSFDVLEVAVLFEAFFGSAGTPDITILTLLFICTQFHLMLLLLSLTRGCHLHTHDIGSSTEEKVASILERVWQIFSMIAIFTMGIGAPTALSAIAKGAPAPLVQNVQAASGIAGMFSTAATLAVM